MLASVRESNSEMVLRSFQVFQSRMAPRSRRRNSLPTIPEKIAQVRPSFPSLPRRNAAEGPGQALRDPVWQQPHGNHRRRPHIARFLATCQLILRRGTPRTGWDPGTPKISSTPPHPARPASAPRPGLTPARLLRPASPRTHEVANASHCPLCPRSGPMFPELGRTGRANRT